MKPSGMRVGDARTTGSNLQFSSGQGRCECLAGGGWGGKNLGGFTAWAERHMKDRHAKSEVGISFMLT